MQTIRVLSDHLSAEPVVFRGFTTPEMGLLASLPFLPLAGVVVPTGMLVTPLLVI